VAIYSILKEMLPAGLRRSLRRLRSTRSYEVLYEAHARTASPHQSIGMGDYELIGRIELGVLLMEGLKHGDTLVDFGCGTGRLAVHVIPRLEGGRYLGIDISKTMLAHARVIVGERVPSPPRSVEFLQQTTPDFPLPDKSVDMVCAFSVFTHMEHEDNFRYLRGARRVIKDEGRFIYSCLPMELDYAREIFEQQASLDAVERWGGVRNVTTTRELMDTLARMAGWEPIRWYPGEKPCIRLPDSSEMRSLGQSICVLVPT
jgi:SAM-dependent methyltransferase